MRDGKDMTSKIRIIFEILVDFRVCTPGTFSFNRNERFLSFTRKVLTTIYNPNQTSYIHFILG